MQTTNFAVAWSLRRKFLICLLIILVPTIALIVAKGLRQRNAEILKAQNDAFLLTQSLATQQQQLVATTQTILTMLAQTREVKTLDAAGCNRMFAEIQRQYPYLNIIAAVTPDGKVFAASMPFTPGTYLGDRKHIQEAMRTLQFSAGEYIVGRVNKLVSLSYAYPVLDAKKNVVVVLLTGYNLGEYGRFVSTLNLPKGYAVLLTDWKGVRLFRWPENANTPVGGRMSERGFDLISRGEAQGFREWSSLDGPIRMYAYRQLRLREGTAPYLYVLTGIPKYQILRQADLQVLSNLALLLLGTAVLLFFAWSFGNTVLVKPITQLVRATQQFAAGQMNARTGLSYASDELGQLARSFDQMAALLEKRVNDRKIAEEALQRAKADLELRVAERTAELAASNQRLTLHRTLSPLAVIEWSASAQVVDWNPAAEHIFGYSLQEALGRDGLELLAPPGEREHIERLWGDLISGRGVTRSTNENLTKEGKIITCDWYNTRLVNSAGEVMGVASIVQDVSEGRQLQQQLLQAQKMDAVGRLAGGVAHDFNNMLMVVMSYSQMLQDRLPADADLRRYTQQILKSAERAANLTRQLLAFSRKQLLTPEIIELNLVVEETVKMLRRLIGEDIELLFKPDQSLRLIKADSGQMVQILMNLCVNARDAMPQGGKLTIETSNVALGENYTSRKIFMPPGSYVMLAVSDTGLGMTEEIKERIFEPFFTTKELGKGTGLGLATVYGIVKQSGGFIWCYSEPGQGTTFKLYFPQVQASAKPASPVLEPAPVGNETILLVEDEEALRDSVAEYLRSCGYQVISAYNGAHALEVNAAHAGTIDILVTDVVMPKMSGRELAEQLTSLRPGMRTLFMSGYTDEAIIRHGVLEAGFAFIQKPYTIRALEKKLREVMAGPVGLGALRPQ